MHGLRWVFARGKLNVSALGYKPVEGGHENDGTPLYIVQALYKDVVYPSKASEKLDGSPNFKRNASYANPYLGAYFPYGGTEKNVKVFQTRVIQYMYSNDESRNIMSCATIKPSFVNTCSWIANLADHCAGNSSRLLLSPIQLVGMPPRLVSLK